MTATSATFAPFQVWQEYQTGINGSFFPGSQTTEIHIGASAIFSIDNGATWVGTNGTLTGDGTNRNIYIAYPGSITNIRLNAAGVINAAGNNATIGLDTLTAFRRTFTDNTTFLGSFTFPNPSIIESIQQAFEQCGLETIPDLSTLTNCTIGTTAFSNNPLTGQAATLIGMVRLSNANEMFDSTGIVSLDFANATSLLTANNIARDCASLVSYSNLNLLSSCESLNAAFQNTLLTGVAATLTGLFSLQNASVMYSGSGIVSLDFANAGNITTIERICNQCTSLVTVTGFSILDKCTSGRQAFNRCDLTGQSIDLTGMIALENGQLMFTRTNIIAINFGDATALTNLIQICDRCNSLATVDGVAGLVNVTNATSAFRDCALPVAEVDKVLTALTVIWTGVPLGIDGGTNAAPTPAVATAFTAAGNILVSN